MTRHSKLHSVTHVTNMDRIDDLLGVIISQLSIYDDGTVIYFYLNSKPDRFDKIKLVVEAQYYLHSIMICSLFNIFLLIDYLLPGVSC